MHSLPPSLAFTISPARTPSPLTPTMAKAPMPMMNPWESRALSYGFPEQDSIAADGTVTSAGTWRRVQDPVIYPGLYAPSGLDVMNMLFRVVSRPNPQVVLGPVDCSVALVLCDMAQADAPIVYVSDSFSELTGYSPRDAIGRNCRFLQSPPGQGHNVSGRSGSDKVAVHRMRQAVYAGNEIQIPVTNYRKDGQPFKNLLTIIPIPSEDNSGSRYCIGFQGESG